MQSIHRIQPQKSTSSTTRLPDTNSQKSIFSFLLFLPKRALVAPLNCLTQVLKSPRGKNAMSTVNTLAHVLCRKQPQDSARGPRRLPEKNAQKRQRPSIFTLVYLLCKVTVQRTAKKQKSAPQYIYCVKSLCRGPLRIYIVNYVKYVNPQTSSIFTIFTM